MNKSWCKQISRGELTKLLFQRIPNNICRYFARRGGSGSPTLEMWALQRESLPQCPECRWGLRTDTFHPVLRSSGRPDTQHAGFSQLVQAPKEFQFPSLRPWRPLPYQHRGRGSLIPVKENSLPCWLLLDHRFVPQAVLGLY